MLQKKLILFVPATAGGRPPQNFSLTTPVPRAPAQIPRCRHHRGRQLPIVHSPFTIHQFQSRLPLLQRTAKVLLHSTKLCVQNTVNSHADAMHYHLMFN